MHWKTYLKLKQLDWTNLAIFIGIALIGAIGKYSGIDSLKFLIPFFGGGFAIMGILTEILEFTSHIIKISDMFMIVLFLTPLITQEVIFKTIDHLHIGKKGLLLKIGTGAVFWYVVGYFMMGLLR